MKIAMYVTELYSMKVRKESSSVTVTVVVTGAITVSNFTACVL